MRCGVAGTEIFRPGWRMSPNAAQLLYVRLIDSRRTIRDIAACVAQSRGPDQGRAADVEKFGRTLLQALWRLDFLAMELNPSQ